jgi:hypothetical protein
MTSRVMTEELTPFFAEQLPSTTTHFSRGVWLLLNGMMSGYYDVKSYAGTRQSWWGHRVSRNGRQYSIPRTLGSSDKLWRAGVVRRWSYSLLSHLYHQTQIVQYVWPKKVWFEPTTSAFSITHYTSPLPMYAFMCSEGQKIKTDNS